MDTNNSSTFIKNQLAIKERLKFLVEKTGLTERDFSTMCQLDHSKMVEIYNGDAELTDDVLVGVVSNIHKSYVSWFLTGDDMPVAETVVDPVASENTVKRSKTKKQKDHISQIEIRLRVVEIISALGLKNSEFGQLCNLKIKKLTGMIDGNKGISKLTLDRICRNIDIINSEWLHYGKGEMFNRKFDNNEKSKINHKIIDILGFKTNSNKIKVKKLTPTYNYDKPIYNYDKHIVLKNILIIMSFFCLDDVNMELKANLEPETISKFINDPDYLLSEKDLFYIIKSLRIINPQWLMSGVGDMLLSSR